MTKFLLILAIFAFAVHAAELNTTDYCVGFSNQTNFNDTQLQNCITCLQSNNSIDYKLSNDFPGANPSYENIRSAFHHAIFPNGTIEAECQPWVGDLQQFFAPNKTSDELFKIIDDNMSINPLYWLVTVMPWRFYLLCQDDYRFGRDEVPLLKAVTGVDGSFENKPALSATKEFLGF